MILDKNGIDYPLFITAFEKMWNYIKNDYMDFFSKKLFFDSEYLLNNGLYDINNDYILSIILSRELETITRQLSLTLEYTDTESIISSYKMRLEIIKAIQIERGIKNCDPSLLKILQNLPSSLLDYL